MTEQKIPISYIFVWIGLIVMALLVIWYAFGSSPTLGDISLGITVLGTTLTWFGLRSSSVTNGKIDELGDRLNQKLEKLNVLDSILNELKNINKKLK